MLRTQPFVQLCAANEALPFDIHGVRTIIVDMSELDSVEKAKENLRRQVVEIERGHRVDSPVSIATAETLLGGESNALAVFLEKFWSIEDTVDHLKEHLGVIESTVNEIEATVDDHDSQIDSAVERLESAFSLALENATDSLVARIAKAVISKDTNAMEPDD
ncbi:MAG: hypothetical protein R3E48_00390 [Burkholderiaceae bacterium]